MVKYKNILNILMQFLHLRTVCKVLENAFPLFFSWCKELRAQPEVYFLTEWVTMYFQLPWIVKDVNNSFATEDVIRENVVQEHTRIPPFPLNNEDMLY